MRRYLVLAVALSLVSALSLGLVSAFVSKDAENLDYRTTVLSGDLERAGDAGVSLTVGCAGHLFWDVSYDLQTGAYTAPFEFSASGREQSFKASAGGLYISTGGSFGASSTPGFDLENDPSALDGISDAYDEIIRQAASLVPAGGKQSFTVSLADRFDTLPVSVDMHMTNACLYVERGEGNGYILYDIMSGYSDGDEGYMALCESLSRLFSIPVSDDASAFMTVTKNADGLVTDIEFSTNGLADVSSVSSEGENGMFFTASFSDGEGRPVEPKFGTGIYLIPYYYDDDIGRTCVDVDAPRLFASLPAGTETLYMTLDGGELVLLTRESERLTCRRFSAESGEELQTLDIAGFDSGDYLYAVFPQDGFIVAVAKEEVYVISRDSSGEMHLGLSAPTENSALLSSASLYNYTDCLAFDFDGERLLAVSVVRGMDPSGVYREPAMSDLIISVFSDGEHLCTVLAESAQRYDGSAYKYQCLPFGDNALAAALF